MQRVISKTLAGLLLLAGAQSASAGEIREDFEAYAVQLDTTGIFDPGEGITRYFVTTDGSMPTAIGDNAKVVAETSDALASGTGIADDSGNRRWVLNSSAGSTGSISGQAGHVLFGWIGDEQPAGPIGALFAAGPKDLTGASLGFDIRENTGNAAATFRFVLTDVSDNEIWTDPFSLTTGFQTITVSMSDFTTILFGGTSFDFTRVIEIGLDVFTTPGTAPALSFYIDNVVLRLPAVAHDFNGDGKADVLWRNLTTGATIVWLMDGTTRLAARGIGKPPLEWQIDKVEDYNGDGKADILWRNTSNGKALVWLMDGFARLSTRVIGSATADWQTQP